MSVKEIDKGWKRIKKQLLDSSRLVVKIGVIGGGGEHNYNVHSDVEGKGEGSNIDLPKLAIMMEYGVPSKGISARPFIAQTYEKNSANTKKFIDAVVSGFYSGAHDLKTGANKIGIWYKGKIQETFRTGSFEANKPKTVAKKGSSRPLIDTGRLRQSIDFEVNDE